MATNQLTQRSPARFLGWAWEETLAANTTGDPVAIPPLLAGQRISVRTQGGTNSAKVQSTISSDAKVAAGTAVWDDWPPGLQIGTVSANIDAPVTALRCVTSNTTSATVLFEILV